MLWDFRERMQPGHIVFAKKGVSKVLGWGIVTSGYRFDASKKWHPQMGRVDWKNVPPKWPPPTEANFHKGAHTHDRQGHIPLRRMVTAYGDIFEVGVKHKRSWFMIANPSQWEPTDLELGKEESYSAVGPGGKPRKNQRAFKEARPGDRVFIYVTAPRQYLWGLGRITAGLIETDGKEIRFANDKKLLRPVPLQTIRASLVLPARPWAGQAGLSVRVRGRKESS